VKTYAKAALEARVKAGAVDSWSACFERELERYRDTIHPQDLDSFFQKWNKAAMNGKPFKAEARFRGQDGDYRWYLIIAVPIQDEHGGIEKWHGTSADINDRIQAQVLLSGENKILEMVAAGEPLQTILEEVCHLVDRISPRSMASVLLVDSEDCLRMGAGPRFPKEFLTIIDGLKIGPRVGSCGTAAYRKEQVIVTDTQRDPLWGDYCELASRYGLRAGWSTPVLSPHGSVSAVFGIYWDEPRNPSPNHFHIIAQVTHLISVAIERQRAAEALRASEQLARGQAEALARSLGALASESNPDRAVEHVLRTVTAQLNAHSCSVWLKDSVTELMVFKFALERGKFTTRSEDTFAKVSSSLTLHNQGPWPEIFRAGRVGIKEDIRNEPDFPWRERLIAQGIITVLVIPMVRGSEVEGIISVRFSEKRKFRTEELDLAQALANQAMLAIQLARLSALSRQSAIVKERNRMARDIHDTLAQGFTGAMLHAQAAQEALSRERIRDAGDILRSLGEAAREGLREARRSVQALRPAALGGKNLAEALEGMVKKLTAGTAVQVSFVSRGETLKIPQEWEANLLRIGQEVIINVLRRARASRFELELIFNSGEIQLKMCDNGCGFDPTVVFSGFGLRGIAERIDGMGGKLKIQSHNGAGTTVFVGLPLAPSVNLEMT
jgi:signal transduction histidine kinase